jgi:hypothetical protein
MPPTTAHQTDRIVTHNKLPCYFKAIYSISTSCFLTTFQKPIPSSTRVYINHILRIETKLVKLIKITEGNLGKN